MVQNGNNNNALYEQVRAQLKQIREQSSATMDNAQQMEILVKRLVEQCREWRASQEELERLIRQILGESGGEVVVVKEEKRQKSHRHRSSRRKRRHGDGEKSGRRSRSKRSKSSRVSYDDEAVTTEQQSVSAPAVVETSEQQHALTVEDIFSSAEKDLCRRCSGDVERKAGAMSNKQLTKLICELLLKDEAQYKCRHCFCEKCTGIKSRKGTRCRKYKSGNGETGTCGQKPGGVCENTQCDKNTQIIVNYLTKGLRSRAQSTKSRHSRRSRKSSRKPRKSRKSRKSQKA